MRSKWFCKYKLAHRGLHNEKYPENSLGAFENAVNSKFAIELDTRITGDDQVVVFHDQNTLRMCGVDLDINKTLYSDLAQLKLQGSKYSIPTLKQVLDLVQGKVPVMIEIKPISRREHLEEKVYALIKDYSGEIAVKSFNPFSMLWFKKNAPEVIRGMLGSHLDNEKLPLLYKFAIKRLLLFKKIKPDFISYNVDNLPSKYVSNKNTPVLAWTIRNAEQEKVALDNACNIIFENYLPSSPINK